MCISNVVSDTNSYNVESRFYLNAFEEYRFNHVRRALADAGRVFGEHFSIARRRFVAAKVMHDMLAQQSFVASLLKKLACVFRADNRDAVFVDLGLERVEAVTASDVSGGRRRGENPIAVCVTYGEQRFGDTCSNRNDMVADRGNQPRFQ